ncbi:MAG: putative bifunctional diguanylate cyclase/phosphodiesterase [Methyloligellaceae bacterium]
MKDNTGISGAHPHYPNFSNNEPLAQNKAIKLLIIEDNEADQVILDRFIATITDLKFEIETAQTLSHAKSILSKGGFDIILLDFYLPDGQAPEFIREMSRIIETPFIVLTGRKDAEVEKEILDSGATDFIPKSELNQTLLARVIKFSLERSKAYNILKEQTIRDPLTGLYNRMGMEKLLAQTLSEAALSKKPFALLLIDIDKFKSINDTYGHGVGDSILKLVSEMLASSTRSSRNTDFAIRVGGDEFALITTALNDIDNVNLIINRLTEKLAGVFEVDGYEVSVSMSIGIAVYPSDGTTQKELMTNADFSLYRAKAKTGTTFEFFDKGMHEKVQKRYFIENSLDLAIKEEQFVLYYQPKYYTEDTALNGFEALIRWNHPQRGMIWPREFIHITEETGHILKIGEWVLREACRQCVAWQKKTSQPITMAVNVSVRQLLHNSFLETVCDILTETGMPPESLELEITESMVIQNLHQSNMILQKLRKMKVAISLDDFGTGYSSLARLRTLPINKLKMDRSLIRKVGKNRFDTAIARTVLSLAKNLKISAVAEGVETEEQYRFLKNANCKEVQGYFFSRPLPASEIENTVINAPAAKISST